MIAAAEIAVVFLRNLRLVVFLRNLRLLTREVSPKAIRFRPTEVFAWMSSALNQADSGGKLYRLRSQHIRNSHSAKSHSGSVLSASVTEAAMEWPVQAVGDWPRLNV